MSIRLIKKFLLLGCLSPCSPYQVVLNSKIEISSGCPPLSKLNITEFVRMYGEGGRVIVEKYGCVFTGREDEKLRFFCVRT